MNSMKRARNVLVIAAVAAASVAALSACELVTNFDRSRIPDAGEGDGSFPDVVIPPFDGDIDFDAETPPSGDAGADGATGSDADASATTDSGDAASVTDGSSDAADGDDDASDADASM